MLRDKENYKTLNLDFDDARSKHLQFKTNLRSVLYGARVNKIPVLSHFECGVGKWIYGHALDQYGHIPEMAELEIIHAGIHDCARELITKYEDGAVEQAREGLAGMELIADKLVSLLDVIEHKISKESNPATEPGIPAMALNNNYTELFALQKTIEDLDARIKEQAGISGAARRQAEKNENKFRNTVMQAPVGIVILSGEDMIVEMANESYLNIIDRRKEEFVGRSLYLSLPEVKDTVAPILLNILKTGDPFYGNEFEVTLNRFGKKETTFFNFVYSPLREEDESITGVMVVATEVTIQVKARMAIEQKDIQFRKLVSQSPIAMTIFRGEDFIIELANDTLLKKIWRKELSAVQGKKLLDIFPELREQQFPDLMRAVLRTGNIYRDSEALAIINSDDGSREYYLDFEYSPLTEIDGSISGIMVTVTDVTEKVISRKKKEMAEKRYGDLLEMLPIAVFTIDKEGYLDLYNQSAVNLWGRTPMKGLDKWCGSHGLYTLDKIFVPHEDCPMATALKENRAITTEAYVQRPGGELRHVIAHPQPMHNEKGDVTGAMNVLIDITERKEAEIALLTSEEKFRVLADSMPQFIWTANQEGVLNYFSQSVFDYSGFTSEKIFKEGWLEIVHPDDRAANIHLWTESVKTGVNFHFEHRFRRFDGEYRWQLSRAVPQKDNQGDIQMWVGTSTDIHDKRLFLDELKEQVDERTKELSTTNENLMKSNAELAQFAYVASHDLQEPLRKIQTFVSRILELDYTSLSPRSRDYFDRINRSSNRTRQLIQDLLTFSRASAIEKDFQTTDLNELLDKVKEDLLEAGDHKSVNITSSPLPTFPVIDFQFEQLFTNLLSNAIKFAKPGTAAIINIDAIIVEGTVIKDPHVLPGRQYHRISFNDNGIGFDPQFTERIFLVFQRLHSKESYEGTGIGLAICKKIVENHNGFITGTGRPGVGATFDIYIPVGE